MWTRLAAQDLPIFVIRFTSLSIAKNIDWNLEAISQRQRFLLSSEQMGTLEQSSDAERVAAVPAQLLCPTMTQLNRRLLLLWGRAINFFRHSLFLFMLVTVQQARIKNAHAQVVYKATNACLAPLCAMDGCHILTVEGIGSTDTELHPVQASAPSPAARAASSPGYGPAALARRAASDCSGGRGGRRSG